MQILPVVDPKAAGLDVGSEHIHAWIGGDSPQVFGTVTAELHRLRQWLQAPGVPTVALEATGGYWLCVYGVLEEAGLEVWVVNGKHVQDLPGRKTDLKGCQWLATLHAHGLLARGGRATRAHPSAAGLAAPAGRSYHDGRPPWAAPPEGSGAGLIGGSRRGGVGWWPIQRWRASWRLCSGD